MRKHVFAVALFGADAVIGSLIPLGAAAGLTLFCGALAAYLYRDEIMALRVRLGSWPLVHLDLPRPPSDEETFLQNPGDGRAAARLIQNAKSAEEAERLFERFYNAPDKMNPSVPYAAFARSLVRFDYLDVAGTILLQMNEDGITPKEIAAAEEEFYYQSD